MKETGHFKCLRCGHEYDDTFTPGTVQERACPKCGSNSVRRTEIKKKADA